MRPKDSAIVINIAAEVATALTAATGLPLLPLLLRQPEVGTIATRLQTLRS